MGEGRPERVRAWMLAPQALKRRAVSRPAQRRKGSIHRSVQGCNRERLRTNVTITDNADRERVELPDEVAADGGRLNPFLLDVRSDGDSVETVVKHKDLRERHVSEFKLYSRRRGKGEGRKGEKGRGEGRGRRVRREGGRTVARQCSPIVETWIPLALLQRKGCQLQDFVRRVERKRRNDGRTRRKSRPVV
jgi:hypothetical protein